MQCPSVSDHNTNFFRATDQNLSEHVATYLVSEPGPVSITAERQESPRSGPLHPVTVMSNRHGSVDRLIDAKTSKQWFRAWGKRFSGPIGFIRLAIKDDNMQPCLCSGNSRGGARRPSADDRDINLRHHFWGPARLATRSWSS